MLSLTLASTGWRASADRVDQLAARALIDDRPFWQIELQERHRALDVDADRSWVDVRWRGHHASHWRTVSGVRVRVEDELGHPWCRARVERLLEAHRVKAIADRIRPDHRDRLSLRVARWQEPESFVSFVDLVRHVGVFLQFAFLDATNDCNPCAKCRIGGLMVFVTGLL